MILTFLTSLFSLITVHPQTIGRVRRSTASAEGACRWVVWWIPCTVRLIIFLIYCSLPLETFYRRYIWYLTWKIPHWLGRLVWSLINERWLVGVVVPFFLLLFRMTDKRQKVTEIRCKHHEPAYYKNRHSWNIIFFTRSIWLCVFWRVIQITLFVYTVDNVAELEKIPVHPPDKQLSDFACLQEVH